MFLTKCHTPNAFYYVVNLSPFPKVIFSLFFGTTQKYLKKIFFWGRDPQNFSIIHISHLNFGYKWKKSCTKHFLVLKNVIYQKKWICDTTKMAKIGYLKQKKNIFDNRVQFLTMGHWRTQVILSIITKFGDQNADWRILQLVDTYYWNLHT